MQHKNTTNWQANDRSYIWHPYSSFASNNPVYPVKSAKEVYITLADGRVLVDGMASWWCAIHGYNVPALNHAITSQLASMAHIMFGGLSHEPAARLATKLVTITPAALQTVFFSDSGSVAVEVAMKMAIQYWQAKAKQHKQKFIALRNGYHGDTFGAMSVGDPITGMHNLFSAVLAKNYFIASPACKFNQPCNKTAISELKNILRQYHHNIAALILEPIVQGAGGMKFYSADYLKQASALCKQYDVLLIADEIATGFGRTGKLFGCEHAAISPDIMCLGKSLTGGYLTLAATLTTTVISEVISTGEPNMFMHGPTFMANPLACCVALASIELLLASPWQSNISRIEEQLTAGLAKCSELAQVQDIRILGGIGVVELHQAVDMAVIQEAFVTAGVWIRPFGKLVYLMPPYIISNQDIKKLTDAIYQVVQTI